MSKETVSPDRPRQVTMAVVMTVVGAAILLLSLFDTLGRLRGPEMRATVDDFLATPPGSGLGIETAQVVEAMRVLVFVSGALAAAAVVFAVFVAQRHHGARIGSTVTAVLLLLTVPVAGLMPFLLAVAAGLLWSRPARDWYAGRPPEAALPKPGLLSDQGPPPSPFPYGGQGGSSDRPPRPASEGQQPPTSPPPDQQYPPAYGQQYPPASEQQYPPAPEQQYPPSYGQQYPPAYGQQYPPAYGQQYSAPGDGDRRPVTVTLAAVLTWLGSGAVLALCLVFAVVLARGGGVFVEEFDKAAADTTLTLSTDEILAVGWSVVAFFSVWSLSAALLAVFVVRRSNVARALLVLSAAMTALVSLLLILSIISVVPLLMAATTVVLLFTGGANDWFARRGGGAQPYPPQSPPSPQEPLRHNQPW